MYKLVLRKHFSVRIAIYLCVLTQLLLVSASRNLKKRLSHWNVKYNFTFQSVSTGKATIQHTHTLSHITFQQSSFAFHMTSLILYFLVFTLVYSFILSQVQTPTTTTKYKRKKFIQRK